MRMWRTENPHYIREATMHSMKTGVWLAVSQKNSTQVTIFVYYGIQRSDKLFFYPVYHKTEIVTWIAISRI